MSVEKILEKRLKVDIEKRGGYCIKLLPFACIGLPDRLVLLPGAWLAFVELKSTGKKLTLIQRVWRNRLVALGFRHYVIDGEKPYLCFLNDLPE